MELELDACGVIKIGSGRELGFERGPLPLNAPFPSSSL